ncbi:MAG: hypothetical protein ABI977_15500 [Acidobacteriota bacterium]
MFAIAPHVNVRDAIFGFDQLLQFLEAPNLIRFAGNNRIQIELASLTTGFSQLCPNVGRAAFARFVVVGMVVIVFMLAAGAMFVMFMLVVVPACWPVLMGLVMFMTLFVIMLAFRPVLVIVVLMFVVIFMAVIVFAFRPVLMSFLMIVAAAGIMFVWNLEHGKLLL